MLTTQEIEYINRIRRDKGKSALTAQEVRKHVEARNDVSHSDLTSFLIGLAVINSFSSTSAHADPISTNPTPVEPTFTGGGGDTGGGGSSSSWSDTSTSSSIDSGGGGGGFDGGTST